MAVGQRGGDHTGCTDPEDLHESCRQLAASRGTEVTLEPLAARVSGEVVEGTEGTGTENRRSTGRSGHPGADRSSREVGRPLQEGDGVSGMVRPPPRGGGD